MSGKRRHSPGRAPLHAEHSAPPDPISPAIRQFLNQACLLKSEDCVAYRALVDAVVASLKPINLIEAGYVKIVIDETGRSCVCAVLCPSYTERNHPNLNTRHRRGRRSIE
jgi:hypothetical protein